MRIWHILKNDLLWYKAGTGFSYDADGGLWIAEPNKKATRTLDLLQNAIASHLDDDGIDKWFYTIEI